MPVICRSDEEGTGWLEAICCRAMAVSTVSEHWWMGPSSTLKPLLALCQKTKGDENRSFFTLPVFHCPLLVEPNSEPTGKKNEISQFVVYCRWSNLGQRLVSLKLRGSTWITGLDTMLYSQRQPHPELAASFLCEDRCH